MGVTGLTSAMKNECDKDDLLMWQRHKAKVRDILDNVQELHTAHGRSHVAETVEARLLAMIRRYDNRIHELQEQQTA